MINEMNKKEILDELQRRIDHFENKRDSLDVIREGNQIDKVKFAWSAGALDSFKQWFEEKYNNE